MAQVSIILPVYKVEKYLRQCLDSIVNQTFKDIEIIIINDCSPDNSLQIIKEYQKKDSRIVLLNLPENKGLSNARNEGMKTAKSKYIVFVDSDDWVREDYVELLFNNIEKYNCDVFSEGFISYHNKTSKYTREKYSFLTTKSTNNKSLILFPSINCGPWSKIYKKDFLLNNNLFFTLKSCEDCFFFYRLVLLKPKIIFKEEPIYFYRIGRETSLTASLYFRTYHIINLIKGIYKTLNEKKLYNEYCTIFHIYAFTYIAYCLTFSSFSTKKMKKLLFSVKRFLFSEKHYGLGISDKFVILIFKFFLNHIRLYKITAFVLKTFRRSYTKIFYSF